MYKNPTIKLTNKSPSYKLLGNGNSSLLGRKRSPDQIGDNDGSNFSSILKSPSAATFSNRDLVNQVENRKIFNVNKNVEAAQIVVQNDRFN